MKRIIMLLAVVALYLGSCLSSVAQTATKETSTESHLFINIVTGVLGNLSAITIFMMIMGTLKAKATRIYKIVNWGGDITDVILGSGTGAIVNKRGTENFDPRYPEWELIYPDKDMKWGAPGDPTLGVKTYEDFRSPMQKWLNKHGLYLFGLWPIKRVEIVTFEKTKMIMKELFENGTGMKIAWKSPKSVKCIIAGKEQQNYIPWRWEGSVAVDGAETGGLKNASGEDQLLPIEVLVRSTLQTTNPLRITTFTQNVQESYRANTRSIVRDLVGSHDIDYVEKAQHQDDATSEFKNAMMKMNGDYGASQGTIVNFGFQIASRGTLFFEEWNPSGEDAVKMIQARQGVYTAEQEAKAAAKRGEGKGDEYANELNKKTNADLNKEDKLGEMAAKNRKRMNKAGSDPNVKVAYDNIGKLSETHGTVIIGNAGVMPTIPLENKEGGSK